ncbi:MAG: YfiR family protein [Parvularculaceae bacterium]|nr:YfiR family protein [Parvularculaceae bacterium]
MFKSTPFADALRKPRRRLLSVVAAVGVLLFPAQSATAQAPRSEAVDALRAAFLFNFAKFTTWPAVSDLDTSIKFCIQANTIDQTAFAGWGKKRIQNRPVRVAFFSQFNEGEFANCSIMFVSDEPQGIDMEGLRNFAIEHNTLFVSDIEGFSASGGHIELYEQSRRLRFKVNLGALDKAKLSLGAGVLNLAEIVGTTGAPK